MTIEAQLPDGRTLQFPDGTDPAIIQGKVKELLGIQQAPPVAAEISQQPEMSVLDRALKGATLPESLSGVIEPALTVASSMVAEPMAGVAGLASAPFVGAEKAAQNVEATREALTFQPRTEEGKQGLENIGEVIAPVVEPIAAVPKAIGDFVQDVTGSPALATIAYTAPAAALEYLGLRKLQKLRNGTRLLTPDGRPTKTLRKALDSQGLDFDNLTPEARALIPEVSDVNLLPGANKSAQASEKALVAQIKAGGRDDALAGLKVVADRVEVDKFGANAVKQGFRPGFVQAVKTANKATKQKMNRMTDIMRRIKKDESLATKMRPSDVVGDSVTDRIKYIRDTASKAKKDLDQIARTKLRGVDIDITPVNNTLQKALDDLDINVNVDAQGIPRPTFKGSLISKDPTSQRVIKDLIDLLSEGGKPDALRAHKLKRQLDIMIDFSKKSKDGLTDAGKGVLKDIRRSLNETVRNVDPEYANVNDILSKSLGSLDELDDAVGSIDIFGKGANQALGTRMRALLSNQQGRVKIDNALNTLDDVAADLGGKFSDNIKDLVLFSDGLDDRFGTVAKTSLSGQMEQGTRQAVREGGLRGAVTEKVAEVAAGGVGKLRGVSDFGAFESMKDLLGR